jgi:hypothetical protein
MPEPKVWVFFYGSFINREVLTRGGLVPEAVETARLWGAYVPEPHPAADHQHEVPIWSHVPQ